MADIVKLSEKPTTTAMAANDTVVMVDASGNVVRINRASLAEAVRSVMATATSSANGLMSKDWFSSLATGKIPLSGTAFTGDLDDIYTQLGTGLSMVNVYYTATNKPTGSNGVLMHLQRAGGDTVTASSQHIMQIYASGGHAYIRSGVGNGAGITYTSWATLV